MKPLRPIILATAIGTTAPTASAFSPPCVGIETFLIVCCPKPCPVIDFARVAKERVRVALERLKLKLKTAKADEHADHVKLFGEAGPRPTVIATGDQANTACPPAEAVLEGEGRDGYGLAPDPEGKLHTVDPYEVLPDADPVALGTVRKRSERVKQQAAADSAHLLARIATSADGCSEMVAKLGNAIPAATDIREMIRRTAELRTAINTCERVTTVAQAMNARVKGAQNLPDLRFKDFNILQPTTE